MNNKNKHIEEIKEEHINIRKTSIDDTIKYSTQESIGYNNTVIDVDTKIVLPVCTICS